MSDSSKWDRLREELQSPWDWAAAAGGGAIGLYVTHGADGGSTAAASALAAVAARKTAAQSVKGLILRRRANKLLKQMQKDLVGFPKIVDVIQKTSIELEDFERGSIKKAEFEKLFDENVIERRKILLQNDGKCEY